MAGQTCVVQPGAIVVLIAKMSAQLHLFKEDREYEKKMTGSFSPVMDIGHFKKLLIKEVTFDESEHIVGNDEYPNAFLCNERWGNKWTKMLVKTEDVMCP